MTPASQSLRPDISSTRLQPVKPKFRVPACLCHPTYLPALAHSLFRSEIPFQPNCKPQPQGLCSDAFGP
jgi:hypothetical protein